LSVSDLVRKVHPKQITAQVLPFLWYLLREMVVGGGTSGGGRSSKLRQPVTDFVTVLYSVLGPELQSAAATSGDVSAGMRGLLEELMDGAT
jgi:hypothetical protein